MMSKSSKFFQSLSLTLCLLLFLPYLSGCAAMMDVNSASCEQKLDPKEHYQCMDERLFPRIARGAAAGAITGALVGWLIATATGSPDTGVIIAISAVTGAVAGGVAASEYHKTDMQKLVFDAKADNRELSKFAKSHKNATNQAFNDFENLQTKIKNTNIDGDSAGQNNQQDFTIALNKLTWEINALKESPQKAKKSCNAYLTVANASENANSEYVTQLREQVNTCANIVDVMDQNITQLSERIAKLDTAVSSVQTMVSDHDGLPIPINASNFGNYVALVIGNEDYAHTRKLDTPIDDAQAIGKLLKNRYGFDVTIIKDATRHDILGALGNLQKRVNSETNVLIFYAGHGHYNAEENRGYWLPVDAEQDNPANWIANDDITSQVKAMSAKHVLVIADSCYSGSITRDARGFDVTEKAAERARGENRYLTKLAGKKTRKVLTSGSIEPVIDNGGNGHHSVFASAFESVLNESDGVMEGTLLFNRIREKVASNADQTPEYGIIKYAGDDGGDFLFIPRQ